MAGEGAWRGKRLRLLILYEARLGAAGRNGVDDGGGADSFVRIHCRELRDRDERQLSACLRGEATGSRSGSDMLREFRGCAGGGGIPGDARYGQKAGFR